MNAKEYPYKQGDIYWLHPATTPDIVGAFSHPYVIIQDDCINQSRVKTVVMCALTTNMKRANEPGNILLDCGEAQLPKQSIVVVSQIETVQKTDLGEYVGSLDKKRITQIFDGLKFLHQSYFIGTTE